MQRDPNHLGANHYYIHAVEASAYPERALPSAARLEKLAPAAGHLVHMPAHIYARVGQHSASAHCNQEAVVADKRFLGATHEQGVYPAMYYSHNLHFLAYANCMDGKFANAKRAADELAAHVRPMVKQMPMLEGFLPTPFIVLVGFERWNEILKLAPPDPSLVYSTAQWHFARAMALAGLKKTAEAQAESKLFFAELARLPGEPTVEREVAVQERGEEAEVIEALEHAVAAQDNLNYSEPPSWYPPIRPVLGRVLLERGQAVAAEKVFRADLERNPRYARSLAGLRDSLKAQKRDYEAEQIEQQLRGVTPVASAKSITQPRD